MVHVGSAGGKSLLVFLGGVVNLHVHMVPESSVFRCSLKLSIIQSFKSNKLNYE